MPKRIFLVHPYFPTMAPIDAAFRKGWPQAQIVNLLDESLYADVPADGTLAPSLFARVATLLHHCEQSGADGIVFTGTTFGPAVDAARRHLRLPVLRAEEAMAEEAVRRGERILVACTAKRAMPIVHGSLEAAAARCGRTCRITELWVAGAKDAIIDGAMEAHDRMIASEIAAAVDFDVIVLGQISMLPARAYLSAAVAGRVIASPDAAVTRLRALVGGR
jgi:Asp/Glu/hydantoin racemase